MVDEGWYQGRVNRGSQDAYHGRYEANGRPGRASLCPKGARQLGCVWCRGGGNQECRCYLPTLVGHEVEAPPGFRRFPRGCVISLICVMVCTGVVRLLGAYSCECCVVGLFCRAAEVSRYRAVHEGEANGRAPHPSGTIPPSNSAERGSGPSAGPCSVLCSCEWNVHATSFLFFQAILRRAFVCFNEVNYHVCLCVENCWSITACIGAVIIRGNAVRISGCLITRGGVLTAFAVRIGVRVRVLTCVSRRLARRLPPTLTVNVVYNVRLYRRAFYARGRLRCFQVPTSCGEFTDRTLFVFYFRARPIFTSGGAGLWYVKVCPVLGGAPLP